MRSWNLFSGLYCRTRLPKDMLSCHDQKLLVKSGGLPYYRHKIQVWLGLSCYVSNSYCFQNSITVLQLENCMWKIKRLPLWLQDPRHAAFLTIKMLFLLAKHTSETVSGCRTMPHLLWSTLIKCILNFPFISVQFSNFVWSYLMWNPIQTWITSWKGTGEIFVFVFGSPQEREVTLEKNWNRYSEPNLHNCIRPHFDFSMFILGNFKLCLCYKNMIYLVHLWAYTSKV